MTQQKLTIIIVSYNTKANTAHCLESVRKNVNLPSEVIVVDNASADGTVRFIQSCFPWANVIQNDNNVGFAAANNQALRMAKGEYLTLLNPDTTVMPGSIDKIVEYMELHADVGIAAGTMRRPDGTELRMETWFPSPSRYLLAPLLLRLSRKALSGDVDFASGACMTIRRSCLDEIGLLDEGIFMYAEDADWCYRAKALGWLVHVVPNAPILHIGGCCAEFDYAARVYNGRQGKLYFSDKHYGSLTSTVFRIILGIEAITKLGIDLLCYEFRSPDRKKFVQQRMYGYLLLLLDLPHKAKFKTPAKQEWQE